MAYNFNDEPTVPGSDSRGAPAGTAADDTTAAPGQGPADAPASPGLARFNSCRWQQPAENGQTAFCTHREVKPYAGTAGFDAEAWCPECQYFKLRRAPKKRVPGDEYSY